MKRLLIALVILCGYVNFCLAADSGKCASNEIQQSEVTAEYQPLFVEGREWWIIHGLPHHYPSTIFTTEYIMRVAVDGEEEIEGILCKRLKVTQEICQDVENVLCPFCVILTQNPTYIYAYEKDRKVYVYRNPGPYFETVGEQNGVPVNVVKYGDPYFDLYVNLNFSEGEYASGIGTIIEEFTKDYNGLVSRTLGYYAYDITGLSEGMGYWIEGIGSTTVANCFPQYHDNLQEWPTIKTETCLVACLQDGKPLYDIRELLMERGVNIGSAATSIEEVASEHDSDETLFTLDGIRVSNPIRGTIYIQNGKKIIYGE